MQPYIFPYIGYFQLISAVDTFVIFDDVNYINRGWINRNHLLADGKKHLFTLKLSRSSQNTLIKDTYILGGKDNREKILKMIAYSYSRAPFFNDIIGLLKKILLNDCPQLDEYLLFGLSEISRYLCIKTSFITSSSLKKSSGLEKSDKIIEIVKIMKADTYINPIGGTMLYNKAYFRKRGVDLFFLESKEIVYPQFKNQFVPNLSIIDTLMFNSKNQTKRMLRYYSLT